MVWGDWSGTQDRACWISSHPQSSSCYLRNWKAWKKKNKTDFVLMNTSQNLTLPYSSRVNPNTILVWGVDGEVDWASVFPSLSLFFWFSISLFHSEISLLPVLPSPDFWTQNWLLFILVLSIGCPRKNILRCGFQLYRGGIKLFPPHS